MLLRADVISALAVTVGIGFVVQSSADPSTAPHPERPVAVSFAEQIQPIFEARCVECHGEESTELGLRLDSYEGVMAGSDYGTIVEVGDAAGSLIIDMIESGDMPEDGDPVLPEELELIKTWISEGAENN
jgi:uncharacterized membrane protein